MTLSDRIVGTIRTAVPGAVGVFIAWLIGKIPAVAAYITQADALLATLDLGGMTVQGLLTAAVTGLIIALYYWLARKAGDRWPVVERWLLGSAKQPVYFKPDRDEQVMDAVPEPAAREVTGTAGDSVIVEDTHR